MSFLRNPHIDLTQSKIETDRCVLVPFSTDGRVDIRELQEEFCKANKDLWVGPFLPSYEEEIIWLTGVEKDIANRELFENFILDKNTGSFIGCIGVNRPEEHRMNIGLWIRESEQGKGYGTEVYVAMLDWAREHTIYGHLKHSLTPENIGSRKLAERFGGILQVEKTESGHNIYHIPL
ncbi:GNAT family N-acetyltransferase [Candidatus Gracilibacteria bacterium]|nr:GNAT family N-acetyltransferase [Candidatus Gracilibacteria bacterium]